MNILSCCFFSNNGKSEQIELTSIGVNTTLAIALFTIISHVAKYVAGPAVCISIIIAGLVAFVTGIFYTELYKTLTCKHLPSILTLTSSPSILTTSASQSSFRHIFNDSLTAFSIGWHLILEYIIAMAIASKTIGYFLDNLIDNVIRLTLETVVPMNTNIIISTTTNWSILSNYFDFFGFLIPIILFLSMCLTKKIPRLKIIDKFMLCITISAVIFIVIAAAFNANISNWQIDPIPPIIIEENGKTFQNGFAPFGIFGIIKGSAIFTFIFIGLDSLLFKSNNQHILTKTTNYCSRYATFVIILCSTIGCAIAITMMTPFYELDDYASIPDAFRAINWIVAQWIVAIGGILILVICAWRQLSSLKQIIGIMIIDGLLIKQNKVIPMSITTSYSVNHRIERSVLIAMTIVITISSLFAGLFSIIQLIYLLSMGTLILFLGISIGIICFRFSNEEAYGSMSTIDIIEYGINNKKEQHAKRKTNGDTKITCGQILKQLLCLKYKHKPTVLSFKIVKILLSTFIISSLVFGLMIRLALDNILNIEIWAITITSISIIITIITILFILLQPTRIMSTTGLSIRLVPLVAPINIFVIIFLIAMLDFYAWIRFGVWSIIGFFIYILLIRPQEKQKKQLQQQQQQQASTVERTSIEKNDPTTSRSTSFLTLNSHQSIPNLSNQNLENDDVGINVTKTMNNNQQNHSSMLIDNQNMTKQSLATIPNDLPIASSTITTNTITDTILMENESTKNQNSNTSSPSSSLNRHVADDEIILAEDIMDNLSERKEANGKIYYVYDKTKSLSVESVSSTTNKEIDINSAEADQVLQSINALDDVISATEQNLDIIDKQNKRPETSTVALIHLPNEYQINNDNKIDNEADELINIPIPQSPIENRKKLSLNIMTPEPDYDVEIPSPDYDDDDITNSDKPLAIISKSSELKPGPHSVDENSLNINSYEFKERLTALLGQNRFLERPKLLKARAPQPPVQTKTDILLTHSQTDALIPSDNLQIPRANLPIKSSFVLGGNKDTTNGVPEAPAFNADIYNTLGRQYSRQHSLVTKNHFDKPLNKFEVVLRKNHGTNVEDNDNDKDDNGNDDDDDDDDEKKQLQRMSSIKDKLENIFRRGPVDRSSRTSKLNNNNTIPVVPEKSPALEFVSNENDNPQINVNIEQDNENPRLRQVNKSIDTIGRQKLIYKDVLRSINNVIGSNENDGSGGSNEKSRDVGTNNNHF